jgi:hypothetical protein
MAQLAASLCLDRLFQHLIEKEHIEFLQYLCPKFVHLFLRNKCDNADFTQCMIKITES